LHLNSPMSARVSDSSLYIGTIARVEKNIPIAEPNPLPNVKQKEMRLLLNIVAFSLFLVLSLFTFLNSYTKLNLRYGITPFSPALFSVTINNLSSTSFLSLSSKYTDESLNQNPIFNKFYFQSIALQIFS